MLSIFECAETIEAIAACLAKGASLLGRDPYNGRTILMRPYAASQAKFVEFLLENGADPKARDEYDQSPMYFCVDGAISRLLLKYGAEVDMNTLRNALREEKEREKQEDSAYMDFVVSLLETGLDINAHGTFGPSPLHCCGSPRLAKLILDRGGHLEATDVLGRTPLFRAVTHDASLVEFLLENGANVRKKDDKGRTPLHFCETLDVARALIAAGAEVEPRDTHDETPLFRAVKKARSRRKFATTGYLDFVEFLLQKGASPRTRNRYDLTPLHACASLELAKLLVAHDAEVDTPDRIGWTPLHHAVRREGSYKLEADVLHSQELIRYLLARGANARVADTMQCTPLHLCQYKATAIALLEHGASLEARTVGGQSVLFHVIREARDRGKLNDASYLELVEYLLEQGADARTTNDFGFTPLHVNESQEMAELLLVHGADIEARSMDDETPLYYAVLEASARRKPNDPEYLNLIRLLLSRGGNPRSRESMGRTPLHVCQSVDVAELLLSHGAEINARTEEEETPLFTAILEAGARNRWNDPAYTKLLAFLLSRGANARAKNHQGDTALHVCETKATAELVLDAGVIVDVRNYRGETPLFRAVSLAHAHLIGDHTYPELIRYLRKRGARISAQTHERSTPLSVCEDPELERILRE